MSLSGSLVSNNLENVSIKLELLVSFYDFAGGVYQLSTKAENSG